MFRLIPVFGLVCIAAGCAVHRDNELKTAQNLSKPIASPTAKLPSGTAAQDAPLNTWFKGFEDPTLDILVQSALQKNPTLSAAMASIEVAAASVALAEAPLYPTLSGVTSVGVNQAMPRPSEKTKSASLSFGWELDVFKAQSRQAQAASDRLQAKAFDLRDSQVLLTASVADTYFAFRRQQQVFELLGAEIASRQQTLSLLQLRADAGLSAHTEVLRAQQSLIDAKNSQNAVALSQERAFNQLLTLTGLSSDKVQALLSNSSEVRFNPRFVPTLPLKALENRADVRSAYLQVQAAAKEADAAWVRKLPKPSLSGAVNFLGSLGSGPVGVTTVAYSLSSALPIFDKSLDGKKSQTQALLKQALAQYEAKLLSAAEDVRVSTSRVELASEKMANLQVQKQSAQALKDALEKKKQAGLASELDYQETYRSFLAISQAKVAAQADYAQSLCALYRSVGAGWSAVKTSPISSKP